MKKIVQLGIIIGLVFAFSSGAYAQGGIGIIPSSSIDCYTGKNEINSEIKPALEMKEGFSTYVGGDRVKLQNALGCAVKTGKIRLYMVPFFITYLIQFLLEIAGILAVLFVVYGGYQYVVGGITEDKDSGKKTITHALIGLLVSLSAWIVVNFIQVALTS